MPLSVRTDDDADGTGGDFKFHVCIPPKRSLPMPKAQHNPFSLLCCLVTGHCQAWVHTSSASKHPSVNTHTTHHFFAAAASSCPMCSPCVALVVLAGKSRSGDRSNRGNKYRRMPMDHSNWSQLCVVCTAVFRRRGTGQRSSHSASRACS